MMKISYASSLPVKTKFDVLIVPVYSGKSADSNIFGSLTSLFPDVDIEMLRRDLGDEGDGMLLTYQTNHHVKRLLLVGLGKQDKSSYVSLCSAGFKAAEKAMKLKAGKAALVNSLPVKALNAFMEGMEYAHYHFSLKKENKKIKSLKCTVINAKGLNSTPVDLDGMIGVKLARDLANLPSNLLTPKDFSKKIIKEFTDEPNIKITIRDEKFLNQNNFNALLAVAQGSSQNPRLIEIHYQPKKKSHHKLVFIGKGITFDSGGISIKPSQDMEEMKYDMAGAAAVAGLMKNVSKIKPQAEIIGLIPAVENMPGDSAVKPGDVVPAYNGKTIEIINTDAEGRLILADTLAYAADRFKPDIIIDLATLTGAVVVSLADKMAGLFTEDSRLIRILEETGKECGERVWALPLDEAYAPQLESKLADLKNIGTRWGGATTAALFLKSFVSDCRWAHLDIAGVAYDVKDTSYLPHGATGYGVKLLSRALPDLIKDIS